MKASWEVLEILMLEGTEWIQVSQAFHLSHVPVVAPGLTVKTVRWSSFGKKWRVLMFAIETAEEILLRNDDRKWKLLQAIQTIVLSVGAKN